MRVVFFEDEGYLEVKKVLICVIIVFNEVWCVCCFIFRDCRNLGINVVFVVKIELEYLFLVMVGCLRLEEILEIVCSWGCCGWDVFYYVMIVKGIMELSIIKGFGWFLNCIDIYFMWFVLIYVIDMDM